MTLQKYNHGEAYITIYFNELPINKVIDLRITNPFNEDNKTFNSRMKVYYYKFKCVVQKQFTLENEFQQLIRVDDLVLMHLSEKAFDIALGKIGFKVPKDYDDNQYHLYLTFKKTSFKIITIKEYRFEEMSIECIEEEVIKK